MALADLLAQDFGTLPDLMRLHAARAPRHAALVQDGRTLDYGELDALIDRVAATLQRESLKPGDAIAICGANSIEFAVVFLGALRAGVAVALLAPSTTAETLADMVADASARHLFIDAAAATTIAPVRAAIAATCIALDGSGAGESLQSWLVDAGAKPQPAMIEPEWPFNIIYSSGTTGTPKGITQPHAMRWSQMQRGRLYGYGSESVAVIATPLYSNTTLVCVFPTLALGGTIVLMGKFEAAGYLALAEQHRATHTMLVPVQYQRIMALADFERYDLSSFQVKLCTSAPFAAALKADILRRWPGGLVEFYGMTEGGGTAVLLAHENPTKLHTVGRPAPGHDIRLIDDAGREAPRGEIGEVVGHSGAMMTGYHGQSARTAEAEWFDRTGKRFFRTGDIGCFDEDGFLVLLDRKKDMVISGGFNIYPSDLEAVIRQRADVAEVAVVGVPSTRWGETPVAFVVAKKGALLDAEQLRQWANAKLGKMQRLAAVETMEALPRSPIGKVLKRELRDAYKGKASGGL